MNTTTNIPFRGWLLGVFLVLLPLSCINAASPIDLLLQHILTVTLLAVLIATGVRHPLSNSSYVLLFLFLFLFLLLHLVGARHLYSFVPYDNWTEQLFGVRLADVFGFRRNHYDRLVHLCFGLLLLCPALELVVRLMKVRGAWSLVIAVCLIIVFSTVYELLEWVVAMVMSPEATERYNGQQGDMWDAHKDTALATGGAVFSALVLALVSRLRSPASSGACTHGGARALLDEGAGRLPPSRLPERWHRASGVLRGGSTPFAAGPPAALSQSRRHQVAGQKDFRFPRQFRSETARPGRNLGLLPAAIYRTHLAEMLGCDFAKLDPRRSSPPMDPRRQHPHGHPPPAIPRGEAPCPSVS